MATECTIQLFIDNEWRDIGRASIFGQEHNGWKAHTYTEYCADWAVDHTGARDAHAFACRHPVSLESIETSHWPAFLLDMLPQGPGRSELLRCIGLPSTAEIDADWSLLRAGASNPVGNLRVKEAAEWLAKNAGTSRGFTEEEVASHGEQFIEYVAQFGVQVAGSIGIQGEWPKLLLTRADDGLLYLDHTLPDARAHEHFIVKLARGPNTQLATIFRHEAPYMELAKLLGLRVHGALRKNNRALFIPRFDRVASHGKVVRYAQESIASLTGVPGFGTVPSHDEVCRQLLIWCTNPVAEVLEYIKRDVANIALGNKDNHARNTAVRRDFHGHISLTPLYDFVPAYLHPDGITRRIRWEGNDDGSPDWQRVIDQACEISKQVVEQPRSDQGNRSRVTSLVRRETLVQGLKAMAPALRRIAVEGRSLGLEDSVLAYLRPGIEAQAHQLESLS